MSLPPLLVSYLWHINSYNATPTANKIITVCYSLMKFGYRNVWTDNIDTFSNMYGYDGTQYVTFLYINSMIPRDYLGYM
jgi:hypothetical protein